VTADDQQDATEGATAGESDDGGAALTADGLYEVLERRGRPVVTASEVAAALDCSHEDANRLLDALADDGVVEHREVDADPVVWYPTDWTASVDRERVTVFPKRREVVADRPTQFTRAQLSQFAHLTDATSDGAYRYEIRQEDVWHAPYDDIDGLLDTVHDTLGVHDGLDGWVSDQWRRARQFRLYTHEDGYVVLEADSESLMGNVASPKLTDGELRGPISDTESWVNENRVADVKRTLYDAGYPVRDDRDLDEGEALDVALRLDLRDYQADWVDRFLDAGSGVLVGPPGSGKTVAAMGVLAAVGGETLVLVPSRELASQWHDELLAKTTLAPDRIGEYHGGTKEIRPVTIATYQTAGMDRHRRLFDQRRWGLIVFDEAQHIPSKVFRRSADLQGRYRLGLTATPVREDDKETDIYTLIGPPIGTDWDALFDAGFVAQPEVEIRYVPWADEMARSEYAAAEGHEHRQQAATNPAKTAEVEHLLAEHDGKALVFVEYLEQGRAIADALDVPFVSGETRHAERERYFDEFRRGARDALVVSRVGDEGIDLPDAELAVVASGLGGSRRQGAQRAGRTMRPTGNSRVYVLATRGTTEEEFARRRTHHLAAKGVQVRERDAETVGDDEGSDGEEADGETSQDAE
jgi:DNA excision repair protein ERCC-3